MNFRLLFDINIVTYSVAVNNTMSTSIITIHLSKVNFNNLITDTKIIDVRPFLFTKGSCILLGLGVTFESCSRLTCLTIEKFTNQTYETITIPNPIYDEDNKNIMFLDEWRKCEKSVSYRVTVETAYNKDTSEKLSVYILKGILYTV